VLADRTEALVYILAYELRRMHQQHGYAVHFSFPRVSLPDLGVTLIRETCTASCEDITPRS
jgi:hypothetical protein